MAGHGSHYTQLSQNDNHKEQWRWCFMWFNFYTAGHHKVLRAYIYSYISWLTSVTIVPSTPARLDSSMWRTSPKEPLLIACCRSAGPLNTREITFQLHSYQAMYNEAWNRSAGPLNTRITFTHELQYFLEYFPQVQYKGMQEHSPGCTPVACVQSKCTWLMSFYGTNTKYVQYSAWVQTS